MNKSHSFKVSLLLWYGTRGFDSHLTSFLSSDGFIFSGISAGCSCTLHDIELQCLLWNVTRNSLQQDCSIASVDYHQPPKEPLRYSDSRAKSLAKFESFVCSEYQAWSWQMARLTIPAKEMARITSQYIKGFFNTLTRLRDFLFINELTRKNAMGAIGIYREWKKHANSSAKWGRLAAIRKIDYFFKLYGHLTQCNLAPKQTQT